MNAVMLHLGWSLVLVWLGVFVARSWKWGREPTVGLAMLCAFAAWWPGPNGASYWLGLAFQTPSLLTMLLCVGSLGGALRSSDFEQSNKAGHSWTLLALPVVTGWVLLLDTFAVFPGSLYALGTGSAGIAFAGGLTCLAWVLQHEGGRRNPMPFFGSIAVVLFALTRMPTGNVWDAVLDPLLWLVLNFLLLRRLVTRYQKRS
jgi:hypothetical protein